MSWDNGYFSGRNLYYLEEKGVDGYIPDGEQATMMKGKQVLDDLYAKDWFVYDETQDRFVCPQGRMLIRKGEYIHNGKPVYAYYGAPCESCLVRAVCAGENRWRMITSYGFEGER